MTRFRPYLAALLVLLGMVGATLWSAWGQRQTMLESSRTQFSLESRDLADNLQEVLNTYAGIMRAGVGLLAVNPDTKPPEWKRFVASLDLPNEFPGVQGVGFTTVVERSQADGGVRQTPSGDMTTAITMLEPEDWRNQRAIGFDMFSEETRQVAMGRARDTGALALSGGVTLVQESGDSVQRGLLMYMPVYEGNGDPENVADRRRLLRGFVYSAYRVGDLINKALTNRNPQAFRNIRMRVYDRRTAQQDRLLFDSRLLLTDAERQVAEARPASLFTQGVTIIVGGQPLHMELSSRITFEDRIDWAKPRAQLAGGLVISLLMAGIVGGLAYARDKSRQGEARLMREITERTRAQEQALLANRELIHRVKNTLAIVNAIASQTARHAGNMTDFNRAFRERLSALGRVHDLLRPDRAGNPDLRELFEQVLAAYRPVGQHALVLEGPPVPIARDDAVLLSLFVNELATNATKYGAWRSPRGRVAVRWDIDGHDDEPKSLVIRWTESDGPPVTSPEKAGFGSNVMRFAVERSMGGSVNLTYPEAGVDHEIRLPWGRTVDPSAAYGQIQNKFS